MNIGEFSLLSHFFNVAKSDLSKSSRISAESGKSSEQKIKLLESICSNIGASYNKTSGNISISEQKQLTIKYAPLLNALKLCHTWVNQGNITTDEQQHLLKPKIIQMCKKAGITDDAKSTAIAENLIKLVRTDTTYSFFGLYSDRTELLANFFAGQIKNTSEPKRAKESQQSHLGKLTEFRTKYNELSQKLDNIGFKTKFTHQNFTNLKSVVVTRNSATPLNKMERQLVVTSLCQHLKNEEVSSDIQDHINKFINDGVSSTYPLDTFLKAVEIGYRNQTAQILVTEYNKYLAFVNSQITTSEFVKKHGEFKKDSAKSAWEEDRPRHDRAEAQRSNQPSANDITLDSEITRKFSKDEKFSHGEIFQINYKTQEFRNAFEMPFRPPQNRETLNLYFGEFSEQDFKLARLANQSNPMTAKNTRIDNYLVDLDKNKCTYTVHCDIYVDNLFGLQQCHFADLSIDFELSLESTDNVDYLRIAKANGTATQKILSSSSS